MIDGLLRRVPEDFAIPTAIPARLLFFLYRRPVALVQQFRIRKVQVEERCVTAENKDRGKDPTFSPVPIARQNK